MNRWLLGKAGSYHATVIGGYTALRFQWSLCRFRVRVDCSSEHVIAQGYAVNVNSPSHPPSVDSPRHDTTGFLETAGSPLSLLSLFTLSCLSLSLVGGGGGGQWSLAGVFNTIDALSLYGQ